MDKKTEIKKPLKLLYIFLGLLSVALGSIGIILPLLPTTPLYILASFFFVKSSPKLHRWLEGKKAYQKTAGAFLATGGLTVKAKLSILIPVLIMLSIMFFKVDSTALKIIAVVLATTKTVFFIKIKTIRSPIAQKAFVQGEDSPL